MLHTRLAINDLTPAGHQPIANEDGSLVMVFNGEIYNSPELRKRCEAAGHIFRSNMDGEVILHLWEMEGPSALARLNGIFALAMASTVSGEVVMARDPLGVKPLFYVLDGSRSMWFASELTALAAAGAPMGEEDLVALAQFLSFMWVPHPRTPYARARSLPPGHALRWTTSGFNLFPYGNPLVPSDDPQALELSAAPSAIKEQFSEAAERQLLSDVPIGLMASGGIDSGLLWWATKGSLDRCFSILWSRDDGRERLSEDSVGVAELHAKFGTPVEWLEGEKLEMDLLPPAGDLFADPAYGLTRLIARRAQELNIKVLLSGQGGDELFGGYRRHVVASAIGRLRLGKLGEVGERALLRAAPLGGVQLEYLARLSRATAARDPFSAYMHLCTYSTALDRARILECTEAEVSDDIVWQTHREVFDTLSARLSFLRKVMTLDLRVYLPGLGLAYVDRAGMEFGVEVRVPWLDLEFVRWSLTVPDQLLVRRRHGKWLPRDLASRVISPQMAGRPKRGFGAPADSIRVAEPASGQRGFRQERYLGLAVSMLERHRRARAQS